MLTRAQAGNPSRLCENRSSRRTRESNSLAPANPTGRVLHDAPRVTVPLRVDVSPQQLVRARSFHRTRTSSAPSRRRGRDRPARSTTGALRPDAPRTRSKSGDAQRSLYKAAAASGRLGIGLELKFVE